MTITVLNQAGQKAAPYQFVIEERRADNRRPIRIVLPYNPDEWDRSFSINWRARNASGVRRDKSDWQSNEPSSLTVSDYRLQMDPEVLEGLVGSLESMAQLVDDITQEPPLLLLSFGIHVYEMVLTRLNVRRVQTDERGYATEAVINMEFVENPK